MKDYVKIEEDKIGNKYFYNENRQFHKLIGSSIEWDDGDKSYHINNINYIIFYKNENILYINIGILELNSKYEKFIKQNIKDLIIEYNPKIELKSFTIEEINELPDWLKDLIIL